MENEVNMNEKSIIKIIWIASLLFLIIQILIEKFLGLELLILGINANYIKLLLVLFLLFLPIFSFDYRKNKAIKKIYRALSIILTLYILFVYMFCFSGYQYFYFYSPYESSTKVLIAEETSFLTSGVSDFYERKYIVFIKRLNGGITYKQRPFSSGTATIKWIDENSVQIDYINSSAGHHATEIVKFN